MPIYEQRATKATLSMLPDEILFNKDLSRAQLHVWLAVRKFQGSNECTWHSFSSIAEHLSMNRPQVSRIIKELVEMGYLGRSGRDLWCLIPEDANYYSKRKVTETVTEVTSGVTSKHHNVTLTVTPCDSDDNSGDSENNRYDSHGHSHNNPITNPITNPKSERERVSVLAAGDGSTRDLSALALSPAEDLEEDQIILDPLGLDELTEAELLAELQALQAEEETITPVPQPEPPAAPVVPAAPKVIIPVGSHYQTPDQHLETLRTVCAQKKTHPAVVAVLEEFSSTYTTAGAFWIQLEKLTERDAPTLREYLAAKSGEHLRRPYTTVLSWYIADRTKGVVKVAPELPAPMMGKPLKKLPTAWHNL
jgi:hypothetical protein